MIQEISLALVRFILIATTLAWTINAAPVQTTTQAEVSLYTKIN